MLPDLHTDFSRGRSGGLVFPSLSEFPTVYCDPHSQRLGRVNKAEIDVLLELSCFSDDPVDVGNLISGMPATLIPRCLCFFRNWPSLLDLTKHVLQEICMVHLIYSLFEYLPLQSDLPLLHMLLLLYWESELKLLQIHGIISSMKQ